MSRSLPHRRPLAARPGRVPRALARLLPILLGLFPACGEQGPDEAQRLADTLLRERAAAHFAEGRDGEARAALAPLVEREDADPLDLRAAAALEFSLGDHEAASGYLARLERVAPDDPGLHYIAGQLAYESGDLGRAAEHLERANELAPGDLPTRIALAAVLADLDRLDEAERLLRSVIEVGIENGQGWYVSAVYRLARLLDLSGRTEEANEMSRRMQSLRAQGIEAPSSREMRLGHFGRILPPPPTGRSGARPAARLAFEPRRVTSPLLAAARRFAPHNFDGDGDLELLVELPGGAAIWDEESGSITERRILDGPVALVRALDFDGDPSGELDIVVFRGANLEFLHKRGEDWQEVPALAFELPGEPSDLVPVDFDHEGDIDLLVVGPFGARLLRNDGADEPESGGRFVDVSAEASLPEGRPFTWCEVEDFDGDNDVDLLLGGPEGVFLADSLRGGRFADASARFPAGTSFPERPLLADWTADGRPDLLAPGDPAVLWVQGADGSFTASPRAGALPPGAVAVDLDLDGSLDALAPDHALLACGLDAETLRRFEGAPADLAAPLAACDLDGDRAVEIVARSGEGAVVLAFPEPPGRALRMVLRGLRDNRRGIGTRVDYRAGAVYRRVFWRGEPQLLGIGPEAKIDVLRIRWPNGVVQTDLDKSLDDETRIDDADAAFGEYTQKKGLVGSCPFLYAWNGETFTFVSDVLGGTPLGLPMAPGKLVPPDHDEFVLVRADQLVPRDGELVLQFTEELREVTYLDRAKLIAVDHPRDVEVFPNERFTFPPFPRPHVHTVRDPLPPSRALGSDGRDWREALLAEDDVHARPFRREAPQYAGLARPWFLELSFDPGRVRDAKRLRLLACGWFDWADASSNMASARHPRIAFVPPILEVPDGEGGWRATGPPVGFPAGKTKTMVLDVTDLLDREDPRLRISTTLALFWDRIALAVDDDEAPLVQTELEPIRARLWSRGFSERIETGRDDLPERFDWDRLQAFPRWDQHPGRYTRLGDVRDLLGAIDDRFVILGSGDALELAFDANALPALPQGYVRDWLVFLDGWAKDRDPNTLEALEVEPLPFHGMSGYPYGADERFPDDEEHRRWREEWNTRPARRWIAPLVPLALPTPSRPARPAAASER